MDERLVKAARDGDVTTLHNLLEEDPDILETASSAHFADSLLHVAARRGKADFVTQIVTLMPSLATETNQQGMIPLHLASLKGHAETVRELLKAKLDDGVLNQCLLKDDQGWTPLHCASQKGKSKVMEELISECPQCLVEVTEKGETVLHLAVKANQFEAVKVLADSIKRHNFQILFKAQDQKGKSAYQLAAAKKQLQVLEVLKEDENGDETRDQEHRLNMEKEGRDREASEKKKSKESQSQDAILVVAGLIITLTYQALTNPPSSFFKDGSSTIDWGCLLNKKLNSQGPIKQLKECPAIMALIFMIFNTTIFFQSIIVVVHTLQGPGLTFSLRLLTLNLTLCYSSLLTAFYPYAIYFAFPIAFSAILLFLFRGPGRFLESSPIMYIFGILAKKYCVKGCMTRRPHQQPEGS